VRVSIREAGPADAPAVAGLLAELDYPSSEEAFRRRFERYSVVAGTHLIAAEEDGEVIGLAAMQVMPLIHRDLPVGRITAMVVRADRRGAGVGRRLEEELEAIARREGCGRIDLTSRHHRDEAHAFYRSLEFEETSRRFVKDLH
jgi:ribosomal protein S18 acetylase RimI-like enzyme